MKTNQFFTLLLLLLSALGIAQQNRFHVEKNFQLQPSIFDKLALNNVQKINLPMLSKFTLQTTSSDLQVEKSLASYNWRSDINRIESIKQMEFNYRYDCIGREIVPEMIELVRIQVINKTTPVY